MFGAQYCQADSELWYRKKGNECTLVAQNWQADLEICHRKKGERNAHSQHNIAMPIPSYDTEEGNEIHISSTSES
jgi:hypothetical protein